jgi:hypothetical protein
MIVTREYKSKFLIIMLSFVISFFVAGVANALSVSPLKQTIVLSPGDEKIISIEVLNDSNDFANFLPEVDSFVANPTNGIPKFGAESEALKWVTFDNKKMLLNPNQTGNFNFKIKVPQSAEPGAYYLGLFARSFPDSGQVGLSSRVGSLFFLYIEGEVLEQLIQTDFKVEKNIFFKPEFNFLLKLKNTGTIHVSPVGYVTIKNIFGNEVARYEINQNQRKVLPSGEWVENINVTSIKTNGIGPLKAEVFLNYGLTEGSLYGVETFWFTPWWSFVGLVVLVIFFVSLYFVFKKRV